MSWIRFGDDFVDDPAVLDLGDDEVLAGWTYVRLVSYAAKRLTDGRIPAGMLRREDPVAIAALIRVGLLELANGGAGHLPRFLEVRDAAGRVIGGHHPSRATVEARRAARAAAGQKGGEASGAARREAAGLATSEQVASQRAEQSVDPVSRSPESPESPEPAPDAREDESQDEVLFAAIEALGVRVNRSNGHADMLRKRRGTHGLDECLRALATLDRPIADAGDAAKFIGDVLRPRPRSTPDAAPPSRRDTDYDALARGDDESGVSPEPEWLHPVAAAAR